MKDLKQYINEDSFRPLMDPGEVRAYERLVAELCAAVKGWNVKMVKADTDETGTLWITSEDEDALYILTNYLENEFRAFDDNIPMPNKGYDVQVMEGHEDDTFIVWWCGVLNVLPCKNPREQYNQAKACYTEEDDEIHAMWDEMGYNDPNKYLADLIKQAKALRAFFWKNEVRTKYLADVTVED